MCAASQLLTEGPEASAGQDAFDAFFREEGVSVASHFARDDITSALVTLGYSVATAAVKFAAKMALRRVDTLLCVKGELRKDGASTLGDGEGAGRQSRTSAWG